MKTKESSLGSARAIRPYHSSASNPLSLKAGEWVLTGKSSKEWPGWVWVMNRRGETGWAPESWIEVKQEESTMIRDYSAAELTVTGGENLTPLLLESGWIYCSNSRGERGWIPCDCIEESPS